MASWACLGCRTVYAPGIPACPHCGGTEYGEDNGGGIVAKASAEGGATHYVAEGDPVPGDLPEGVRLVGPGAPSPGAGEPEAEAAPEAEAPASISGDAAAGGDGEDGPADYGSLPVAVLRELARERGITQHGAKKDDLAAALAQWDAGHPGDSADDGDADDGDADSGAGEG